MSKKTSKLDLLVRVRYSNPLPAPPCPPKLLDIPTDPMRHAAPEFLDSIVNATPVPMIVDADCGMPLDLSVYESLWEEDADDSELNPDPLRLPKSDPRDAFLLGDIVSAPTPYTNGQHSGPSTSAPLAHVPWLRKTEYISRDSSQRSNTQEPKHIITANIDVSRAAQLRDIEASFTACNENFELASLRHPTKPNVTAVESYEVFPNADIWANQYDLFKFSERPGDRAPDIEDPRLDCAILRPMKTEHDSFLAYYLSESDQAAYDFKEMRRALAPYEVSAEEEETIFKFIRDYETVKVEQEVPNEFLLVLHDGDPPQDLDDLLDEKEQKAPRRERGAYYKNIERKMTLKKKRVNDLDKYEDKWDRIRMTHAVMSTEEEDEREEALAEVIDPNFLLIRGDADADGEEDDGAIIAGTLVV
ncbi:RNA polymerase II-associated protein [Pluteus cervinus]|uniref:RNA polymerase II-associated protein n=1 Tax=Pluteus cervinus TaxID=181527 RepID=A0ACD3BBG4_9AGAR|nr:RNA polymerase II-associated protein [Pluteus cervinus]